MDGSPAVVDRPSHPSLPTLTDQIHYLRRCIRSATLVALAKTLRHTHHPNTTIDISSSISLLPQHPPMPHSSLTFLPLLIHPIHYPRPCAPNANPHHKSQYIPRPQRPTTPISICPSRSNHVRHAPKPIPAPDSTGCTSPWFSRHTSVGLTRLTGFGQ